MWTRTRLVSAGGDNERHDAEAGAKHATKMASKCIGAIVVMNELVTDLLPIYSLGAIYKNLFSRSGLIKLLSFY